MSEHYTNLSALRLRRACESRYTHLVAALGPEWGDDDPIPLTRILDINGLDDAIWALRANLHPEAAKYSRLYACDSAERVAHLNLDPRVQAAIDTGRRYAHGEATDYELSAAADAARSAEADGYAAGCAAGYAAGCAAGYAAARAAWDDAARAAAKAADAAWGDAARAAANAAGYAGYAARTVRAAARAAWDAAARAAGCAEREWQEAHFRKMFG
jgi:hypothetical protein